jgi:hypothetical protein
MWQTCLVKIQLCKWRTLEFPKLPAKVSLLSSQASRFFHFQLPNTKHDQQMKLPFKPSKTAE